ncbi:MAG: hypothetical protein ABIG08_03475 [bacterium]
MKVLIAYYSRTGGTEKVAQVIKSEFEKRNHFVDIENIKAAREHSLSGWWHLRMIKGECDIQAPKIQDVSDYDVVCLGSPNWTRLSLPVARYIRELKGLKHKKVGFFATTALWPSIEWYVFSAYLLDFTFSRIINQKGGRIIETILLSSALKKWNFASKYGKRLIKNFCDKLETPIISFKDYFLKQKETEETRLLTIVFSTILLFSLFLQVISSSSGRPIFTWSQYWYLFAVNFLACFFMLIIMERKRGVFLGKYLAGFALISGWTLTVLYITPTLGRSIILIYVLLFIFVGFFRELKAVLFTGFIAVLSYFFLLSNYPRVEILFPSLDLSLLAFSVGVVGFIAQSLKKNHLGLLEAQDEIERAKEILEIKVDARTRELKNLSMDLEKQVGNRTKELQEKIGEMEKFNKLIIGRELKMVQLKEEIQMLKEKLEKIE